MATKYIYIGLENSKTNTNLFSDFEKEENAQVFKINKIKVNGILKFIRKIHLSKKIAKILPLPMKWIWYNLKYLKIEPNENYVLMMLPTIFAQCDISVIKRYSKYKNVKLVLILLDTVGVDTPVGRIIDKLYKDKMWDYIFSYDYEDAKKYGFQYLDECYYSKRETKEDNIIENDGYFIGALKPGRTEEIIELFEYLNNNGAKPEFEVVLNDGREIDYNNEHFIISKERREYQYIVDKIQHTNCIIEFLQKDQQAQSLRYFEAVCFNKKLLTNNKNVKRLSFYNEKYMKVFDNFEDIDVKWLKEKEFVNYGYNGEFSPVNIINKIEKLERIND